MSSFFHPSFSANDSPRELKTEIAINAITENKSLEKKVERFAAALIGDATHRIELPIC
jgi:hypothetical protein